jgi:hypothetical protein
VMPSITRRSALESLIFVIIASALVAECGNQPSVEKPTSSEEPKSQFSGGAVTNWMNWLIDSVGSKDDSTRFVNWLRDSRIIDNRPDGSFHSEYSNRFAFASDVPFLVTPPTVFKFGIDGHPWISPVGRSQATELNNLEVGALGSADFTSAATLPFPDTLRLPPESKHRAAFARFIESREDIPTKSELVYVRYFVSSRSAGSGSGENAIPQVRVAYVYQPKPAAALSLKFATLT